MIKSQVNIKDKGSFNVATKSWENVRITPVYPLSTNDGVQQNITVNPPNINDVIADNTGFIWKINNVTKTGSDFIVTVMEQTSDTPTNTLLPDITFEKAAMCTPNVKGLLVPHFHDSFVSTNAFRNALSYNMKKYIKVNINYLSEQDCINNGGYWYFNKCNKIPNPIGSSYSFQLGINSKLYYGYNTIYVTDKYDYTWQLLDTDNTFNYNILKDPDNENCYQLSIGPYGNWGGAFDTNDQPGISGVDITTGIGYYFNGKCNPDKIMGIGDITSVDSTKYYPVIGDHRFKKLLGSINESVALDINNNLWYCSDFNDDNKDRIKYIYNKFDDNKYLDINNSTFSMITIDGQIYTTDCGCDRDFNFYHGLIFHYYLYSYPHHSRIPQYSPSLKKLIPSNVKFKSIIPYQYGIAHREYYLSEDDYLYERGAEFSTLVGRHVPFTYLPKKVCNIKFSKVQQGQAINVGLGLDKKLYAWGTYDPYTNKFSNYEGIATAATSPISINISNVLDFILTDESKIYYITTNLILNKIDLLTLSITISCGKFNHDLCTTQSDCINADGYWYNNICNGAPIYSNDNFMACTTQSDCINANGYWYNNICNSVPHMKLGPNSKLFRGRNHIYINDINNQTWISPQGSYGLLDFNQVQTMPLFNVWNLNFTPLYNPDTNTYYSFKDIDFCYNYSNLDKTTFIDKNTNLGYTKGTWRYEGCSDYHKHPSRLYKMENDIQFIKITNSFFFGSIGLDINGKLWILTNGQNLNQTDMTQYEDYIPFDQTNTYTDICSGYNSCIGIRSDGTLVFWGKYYTIESGGGLVNAIQYTPITILQGKSFSKILHYSNFSRFFYINDSNENTYIISEFGTSITNTELLLRSEIMSNSTFDIKFSKISSSMTTILGRTTDIVYGISKNDGTLYSWIHHNPDNDDIVIENWSNTISIVSNAPKCIDIECVGYNTVFAIDTDYNIWGWNNIDNNTEPEAILAPGLLRSETPIKIYSNFTD